MEFERECSGKIKFNISKIKKFNDLSIEFIFRQKDSDNFAERYLISKLLINSLFLFKSRIDVKKYYMELNDALVNSGVRIADKGTHELYISFSFLKPELINDDKDYTDKIIECINNVLFYKRKEKNIFDEELINIEKQVILNELKNRIDDKQLYVIDKINELMFKDTVFKNPAHGSLEDYDKINNQTLYKNYINCLEKDDIVINIVGYDQNIIRKIKELCITNIKNDTNKSYKINFNTFNKNINGKFKTVIEKQCINQTKIALGYKVDTDVSNNNYFSYKIANEILGGSVHSNLFQNVRENNSLCYYIYSFLSEHKGSLYILCGIDGTQISKTIKLIKNELKTLQEGNFTNEQIFMAKESITSSLFYKQDNPKSIMNLMNVWNTYKNLDEIKKKFEKVTKEEIIYCFNNLIEDKIFILEEVKDAKTTN